MGQQTVIAHTNTQTTRDPVEHHRGDYRGPTPKPEGRDGAEMEDAKENALAPINAPFGGHNFIARVVPQNRYSSLINTRLFLIRQWLELGQGMFALQVRQLNSSTRQDSFNFKSTFVGFASGHYFRPKRQLHPDCGTGGH